MVRRPGSLTIGIDVSQAVYIGTGVATYVRKLVPKVIALAPDHDFVLFGSAWGRRRELQSFIDPLAGKHANVRAVTVMIPPRVLSFLWNDLHVLPVERFTGPLDVFWSSDWTQPPLSHAKGITTVHDLSVMRTPESFNSMIRQTQEKRMKRAVCECSAFLTDSDASAKDMVELMGIEEKRIHTVYPGYE